jgi:hypothetical protein
MDTSDDLSIQAGDFQRELLVLSTEFNLSIDAIDRSELTSGEEGVEHYRDLIERAISVGKLVKAKREVWLWIGGKSTNPIWQTIEYRDYDPYTIIFNRILMNVLVNYHELIAKRVGIVLGPLTPRMKCYEADILRALLSPNHWCGTTSIKAMLWYFFRARRLIYLSHLEEKFLPIFNTELTRCRMKLIWDSVIPSNLTMANLHPLLVKIPLAVMNIIVEYLTPIFDHQELLSVLKRIDELGYEYTEI